MVRKAANYVDRILKGEKPGDLPLNSPLGLNSLSIENRKGAHFEVPPTLLALADAVIG